MRRIFVIIILFYFKCAFAQEGVSFPSPNNNFLANSGSGDRDVSVNLYTGKLEASYQLANLESKKFNIPASLSYVSGNGVKVQENAGIVGLGWQLSVGGSITRVVRGLPDDNLVGGYLYKKFNNQNIAAYLKSNYLNNTLPSMSSTLVLSSNQKKQFYDTEPDMFMVSTPYFSFQFNLDENGKPVFKSADVDLKFESSNFINSTTPNNSSFIITDGMGNKYYFGSTSQSREIHSKKFDARANIDSQFFPGIEHPNNKLPTQYISAWYLDKIVSADSKDIVTFDYIGGVNVTLNYWTWSGYIKSRSVDYSEVSRTMNPPENSQVEVSPKYLSKVTTSKGVMELLYELPYIRNDNNYKALTQIVVKDKNLVTVVKKNLTYENERKLFLSRIEQVNISNNSKIDVRLFEYENPLLLPDPSAFTFDYFGYYIGLNWDQSMLFSPSVYRKPTSNIAYTSMGVLKGIKNNTGSETKILYQANTFQILSGIAYGPGLRVNEIKIKSSERDSVLTRYEYESDGQSWGSVLTRAYDFFVMPLGYMILENGAYYDYSAFLSELPTHMHDLNGVFLGYSKVKVIDNQLNYAVYEYYNFDTHNYDPEISDIVNVGFNRNPTATLPTVVPIHSSISRANRRGLISKVSSFDKFHNPLSITDYEYSLSNQSNQLFSFGITAKDFSIAMGNNSSFSNIKNTVYYTRPEFYYLSSATSKKYIGSNFTTDKVTYKYDNNHCKLRSTQTTNSKGQNVIEEYFYVRDLNTIPRVTAAELNDLTGFTNNYIKDLLVHQITKNTNTGLNTEKHNVFTTPLALYKENLYLNNNFLKSSTYSYTSAGDIASVVDQNNLKSSYLYNSDGNVVLEFTNADHTEVFYQDFENFHTAISYLGKGAGVLPFYVPHINTQGKKFFMDYRIYENGKWRYVKKEYASTPIMEGQMIDEFRIYPEASSIISYTYKNSLGLLQSKIDANGIGEIFEYDGFNRLMNVSDCYGNILKTHEYHNKTYYNTIQSGWFKKDDCPYGQEGNTVEYIVYPGAYSSNISPEDANRKAKQDVKLNGQSFANRSAGCKTAECTTFKVLISKSLYDALNRNMYLEFKECYTGATALHSINSLSMTYNGQNIEVIICVRGSDSNIRLLDDVMIEWDLRGDAIQEIGTCQP